MNPLHTSLVLAGLLLAGCSLMPIEQERPLHVSGIADWQTPEPRTGDWYGWPDTAYIETEFTGIANVPPGVDHAIIFERESGWRSMTDPSSGLTVARHGADSSDGDRDKVSTSPARPAKTGRTDCGRFGTYIEKLWCRQCTDPRLVSSAEQKLLKGPEFIPASILRAFGLDQCWPK